MIIVTTVRPRRPHRFSNGSCPRLPWPPWFLAVAFNDQEQLRDDLTEAIIGAFWDVYHELGHGFVESVYERSMVVALRQRGLAVERQIPVIVQYRNQRVGRFLADLVVEGAVMVELKACRALDPAHEAQLLNYLRASTIEVGLLLLFAPRPRIRRLILTNDRKMYLGDHAAPPSAACDA